MATVEAQKKETRLPEFKNRFNELRGDMPQSVFAEKIGIARATVGFYENGERLPDALTLKQIADKTGVSTDWLLGRTDDRSGNADVMVVEKRLGLSPLAQEMLKAIVEKRKVTGVYQPYTADMDLINPVIESPSLDDLTDEIYRHIECLHRAMFFEAQYGDVVQKKPYEAMTMDAPMIRKYDYIKREHGEARKMSKYHLYEAQQHVLSILHELSKLAAESFDINQYIKTPTGSTVVADTRLNTEFIEGYAEAIDREAFAQMEQARKEAVEKKKGKRK